MSSLLKLLKTILVYLYPIPILIGLVTNSLTFIIFSRQRFQNTIFSTYFRFYLAIETLSIFFPITKILELNFDIKLGEISKFTCKLRLFISYVNFPIASWILVSISLDRYLSIVFPTKFLYRKKPIFQLIISLFIIGFNVCLYTPIWIDFSQITQSINETNKSDMFAIKCSTDHKWINLIDLFYSTVIPFLFMICFTLLTIKKVYDSRRSTSNYNKKDLKFAILTIMNNILFLILNLPAILLKTIKIHTESFNNLDDLYQFIHSFLLVFVYIDMTLTFFINLCVNSLFKKELYDFIHLIFRRNN